MSIEATKLHDERGARSAYDTYRVFHALGQHLRRDNGACGGRLTSVRSHSGVLFGMPRDCHLVVMELL